MFEIRRFEELGRFENAWLKARYHFSFSGYHDPARMGFGPLRVINDDRVLPGTGFDFHGHRDMEIITFVRSGAISHEDSLGNKGATRAGEVQVMSAGKGILHAEHNHEAEATRLYQIWIEPHTKGVQPRWEHRAFPQMALADGEILPLLASGLAEHEGKNALMIHAHAAVYGGQLSAGQTLHQSVGEGAYLLVSNGEVRFKENTLVKGDALILSHENALELTAATDAELVLIDLPQLS